MKKFLLPLLLLWSCLQAQRYSFRQFTPADGISSSVFNHIFQDSKGYLWFATQGGGVSRFNGKDFVTYKRANGLCSNDATWVTEDANGTIWMATTEGATAMHGKSFTRYGAKEGLTDGVVFNIFVDEQNRKWFATQDDGIKVFDGQQFTALAGLPVSEIYTIHRDADKNLVFGTAEGIYTLRNGKVSRYSEEEKLRTGSFFCSALDAQGKLWLGSTSGDVVILGKDRSVQHLPLPAICQNDFIGSIAHDTKGNTWLGTDHGLLKYDGKNFKLFGTNEGLSVDAVQAVACDAENNVWAGTLNGGLNLLRSEAFVRFGLTEGLTQKQITALLASPDGKLALVGTDNGLFVKQENRFEKVSDKSIAHANISSLAFDPQGELWVTALDGVYHLTPTGSSYKVTKVYTELAGKRIISPQKVIVESNGAVWIATYGSGLFKLQNGKQENWNTETGLPSDKIITLHQDASNTIWLGTQDAGAVKFDGKTFTTVSINAKVKDKAFWSMAEDESARLYFGTGESGVMSYESSAGQFHSLIENLHSDFTPALVWDKQRQCLWSAGDKGFYQIKRNPNKTFEVKEYDHLEGLGAGAINQNCMLLDATGSLWMGSSDGLWRFNPALENKADAPIRIQLTSLQLFYGKESLDPFIRQVDSLTGLPINLQLPHHKNHLTFNIQALTTAGVSYIVKLVGYDEDWSAPMTNNAVTYNNIPPGNAYIFQAKAIGKDGKAGSEMASFAFTVNAPWWKTWWFYLVATVSVLSLLVFIIKYRERMLRQENVKLEDTVKQRTQTIEQQKQTVEKMLSEKEVLLKEIHHRVKNNLQTISSMLMLQGEVLKDEQAQKAITESQSRVRSIALVHQKLYQTDGLEKVELQGFLNDLTVQVKSLYPSQASELTLSMNGPTVSLLIDKAIPLGLIINELLTNSFKYAFEPNSKGEIKIQWEWLANENTPTRKLQLSYSDNGKGFDYHQKLEANASLGVELVSLLSEQIGAEISFSNANGTEFVFIFGVNI